MPRSRRSTRKVTRAAPVASHRTARIASRRALSSAVGLIGGIYHAVTEAGEGDRADDVRVRPATRRPSSSCPFVVATQQTARTVQRPGLSFLDRKSVV